MEPLGGCKLVFGTSSHSRPDDDRVFYIETGRDRALTAWILDHHSDLIKLFRKKGLTFVYLNSLILSSTTKKVLKARIKKLFPGLEKKIDGNEYKNIFKAYDMDMEELKNIAEGPAIIPKYVTKKTDKAFIVALENNNYESFFKKLAIAYARIRKNMYTDKQKTEINQLIEEAQVNNIPYSAVKKAIEDLINSPALSQLTIEFADDGQVSHFALDTGQSLRFKPQQNAIYLFLLERRTEWVFDSELVNYYLRTRDNSDILRNDRDPLQNVRSIVSKINGDIKKSLIQEDIYKHYMIQTKFEGEKENKHAFYRINLPPEMVKKGVL